MAINYENLDNVVRAFMYQELKNDIASSMFFINPRLNGKGVLCWPELLGEAVMHHDDEWLTHEIRQQGLLNATEQRRTPSGGMSNARIPDSAADTLAESDFNRYYVRGLCLQVMAEGQRDVEVYRGKAVKEPRAESLLMIGKRLQAEQLLEALRHSSGHEAVLGVLLGPNSGLSVKKTS
ncbi:hypothetical protein [Phytohalomonas tamaricis]|uniref:hypothetical protein n=1 Tax=Phytohalomonas tamaricis TaxID=2081032 RepID=UPI001319FB3B|nr:hypothetical protein [Phytohalomonas tamaricis]